MADSIAFGQSVIDNATGYTEQQMAPQEMPFFVKMLEGIPAAPAAAGHFTRRGANTILQGGGYRRSAAPGPSMPGGEIRRGVLNNNPLNPRNWNRMESADALLGRGSYNPYMTSRFTNWAGRRMAGGGRMASSIPGPMGARASAYIDEAGQLTTGGFTSRMGAAAKIGRMSDARYAGKYADDLSSFVRSSSIERMGMSTRAADEMATFARSSRAGGRVAALTTGGGALTGRMGGFASVVGNMGDELDSAVRIGGDSMTSVRAGGDIARRWADDIGLKAGRPITNRAIFGATRGAVRGAGLRSGAKVAAKGGAMIGARLGLLSTGPIGMALMTAWAAYDLTKLGVQAVGYAAKTAAEGYKSMQGGMRTRMMDPGFVDTEASLTSRQRGVMAIQNSRLNARSVLGSEAGAMASHFG